MPTLWEALTGPSKGTAQYGNTDSTLGKVYRNWKQNHDAVYNARQAKSKAQSDAAALAYNQRQRAKMAAEEARIAQGLSPNPTMGEYLSELGNDMQGGGEALINDLNFGSGSFSGIDVTPSYKNQTAVAGLGTPGGYGGTGTRRVPQINPTVSVPGDYNNVPQQPTAVEQTVVPADSVANPTATETFPGVNVATYRRQAVPRSAVSIGYGGGTPFSASLGVDSARQASFAKAAAEKAARAATSSVAVTPDAENILAAPDAEIEKMTTPPVQGSNAPYLEYVEPTTFYQIPSNGKVDFKKASANLKNPENDSFPALVRYSENTNNDVISTAGARGVMQVKPETAKSPGYGVTKAKDDSVKEANRVGVDYANAMFARYNNDPIAALAAYNWGPGNVDKWLEDGGKFEKLPKATKDYINRARPFFDKLQSTMATTQ